MRRVIEENALTMTVNGIFGSYNRPWQVAAITASSVLYIIWLWNLLNDNESIYSRSRKSFFRLAKKLPWVRRKIEAEINKISKGFEDDVLKNVEGVEYLRTIPYNGLNDVEIMNKLDEHLSLGHYNWKDGHVSGAVYNYNADLINLITNVYGKASYTNPLHADIFPGICKMEAEVVRMTANLFHGDEDNSCGTMTTGGSESIILACKAYRDFARETKGITKPNIIAPTTAHAAFDKAGQYFGIYVNYIKLNPRTTEVDISKMESAINNNTILLVGSAPNFPYGTMDDIEAIAKLGLKYNIPVHVDACLGGFLIAFMKQAGYYIKPFDFSVKGVTSISADTHKYGFAPKGSSVILYSDKKYRHYQYTVTTEWPGGVYGSPTINGSRAGGIIAACWATLLNFGQNGYIEATKKIIDTTKYIERKLKKVKEIYVFGKPATSVVAFGSNVFDIFRLSDALCKLGWNLNALQFPSGIHLCVTYMHTFDGVADKFIADVNASIVEIMLHPKEKIEGKMAIYGVAQSVPDRTIVGDFTTCFLDSMYYTPKSSSDAELNSTD